ncbi:MAG TPA: DNRLRE domain-containing protein [Planctomycetota bacterium]|nr:DNRLRE domain-containing protein [Planctomycetota bacterium]
MRHTGLRFALLGVVAVLMMNMAASVTIVLWSPRQVNPAFVEPGRTFTADVQGPSWLSTGGWSASLANDLRSWNCTVTSAVAAKIKHGTLDGWKLTIRVPSDVPPELFKLTVSHSAGASASWSHAVSVVPDLEAPFYILHMTDEHARDRYASQASGYRSAELVGWAAPVVNLINPRFVLNSGDDVHDWWKLNRPDQISWYKASKAKYRVPTIIIPGNHDVAPMSDAAHATTTQKWDREMGYRGFSVRMGPSFYLLGHDYYDGSMRTWASEEWNRSFSDSAIAFRVLTQHYTDAYALRPGSGRYPHLMLVGHLHYNDVVQTTPYPLLITTTAADYAKCGFLEFRRTSTGGWYCPSVSTHENAGNQIALVGDWGSPRITTSWAKPNDGTSSTNSVSITNRIGRDFYDGRVRFLLPAGEYAVKGGQKLAQYSYSNGSKTAVVVKVNIARNATTTVSVSPSSEPVAPVTRFFQNGLYPSSSYAGTRDTYISASNTTTNYGASTALLVDGDDPNGTGRDKAILIKWDLSSIPPGSRVQSASITFDVLNPSSQSYEIYRAGKPWVEGEATWNVYRTGSSWEVPGAKGSGDRGTTVRGKLTGTSTGLQTMALNADGVALIQQWVDNPSSNFGFIIANASNTDGIDLSSREIGTASRRPKLAVTYVPASTTTAKESDVVESEDPVEPDPTSPEVLAETPEPSEPLRLEDAPPPAPASPDDFGAPVDGGDFAAEDSDRPACGATGIEALIVLAALLLRRRKP